MTRLCLKPPELSPTTHLLLFPHYLREIPLAKVGTRLRVFPAVVFCDRRGFPRHLGENMAGERAGPRENVYFPLSSLWRSFLLHFSSFRGRGEQEIREYHLDDRTL